MRALSLNEVSARTIESLGLDRALLGVTSIEVIACALRRAAGFLCPCPSRTLVNAVLEPLQWLCDDAGLRSLVEDTLEALVVHGDLLELRNASQEPAEGALLFAAPPSFVKRLSGTVMILGVAPDGVSPIPDDIGHSIEYVNHIRLVRRDGTTDLADQLAELGLIELSLSSWTKAPKKESAAEHLQGMGRMLDGAQPSGDIPGLVLLDPERAVHHYRRRWVEPSQQTGRFVGRRPQAYGADLWCYVEVFEGRPIRLIDFPIRDSVARGCDDAWRLQAAIDHERGAPQVFRVRPGTGNCRLMDFFSPVPMWARRRWDAIAEPVPASRCLFTYAFSETEIAEELAFAKEHMWLAETS